jgi:hypothetical protein
MPSEITSFRPAVVAIRPLGPRGLPPEHEWVSPGNLRFRNPDGTWGAAESLTAPPGVENLALSGSLSVATDGDRIGFTSDSSPLSPVSAFLHIKNTSVTNGLRVESYWTGATGSPYQNNDGALFEVYNDVGSSSLNRSWAVSAANCFNNIPVGVTDTGTRVGVLGWSVSVNTGNGYVHAGTLATQIGVGGVAGFQGAGSAASAVITEAIGLQGSVYAESAGATIANAYGGLFDIGSSYVGTVVNNYAIRARAVNGTNNWVFYGDAGTFYNEEDMVNMGQVQAGSQVTQSSSSVATRKAGNSIEFGHPDPGGYVSNIGATFTAGHPFFALCAEADDSGNTFTTRGKLGTVIHNNLAGSLIFSRVTNANASGQSLTEMGRFYSTGGFAVGAPTGGDKGAGTINAQALYDDNVLLTCAPVQELAGRPFVPAEWDAMSPTGEHKAIRYYAKMKAQGFDGTAKSFVEQMLADGAVPGLFTPTEWSEDSKPSLGEVASRLFLAIDLLALAIKDIEARLDKAKK